MAETYEHRQPATVLHVALAVAFVACAAPLLLLGSEMSRPVVLGMGAVCLVLLVAWFLFRSMTVRVDASGVTLRMGSGWPRHHVPLETITAVETTRRSWLHGYGIRWSPAGWMWRISGPDAVALTRGDSKRFFVGSDEAEALADAIRDHLADDPTHAS